MSVFGEPIVLPKLEKPSHAEVDKWHGIYIEVQSYGALSATRSP